MGTLKWKKEGNRYWQLFDDDVYVSWLINTGTQFEHLTWHSRDDIMKTGVGKIDADNWDDAKAYVVAVYRMGG